MKKLIVIPTDFSPAAACAASYAIMLAGQLKADIRICHATESFSSENDSRAQLEGFARELAEHMKKKDHGAINSPEITVLNGKSGNASNFSTGLSGYIIVIGTSGAGRQNTMWTGRGGENILRVATSQVLLVPFPTVIHPPRKILFATTMDKNDQPFLAGLTELARELDAEVVVAHIDPGSYDHESRKNQWLCFTEKVCGDLTEAPHFSYLNVPSEQPAAGLADIIAQESIDMLAVSRNIYGRLSSLLASGDLHSREMASSIRIPILVGAASVL